VKRYLETFLMILLMGIGLIPLIADTRGGGQPQNNDNDSVNDAVVITSGLNSTANAAGYTTSISGIPFSVPTGTNRLVLVVLHYEVPDGAGTSVKNVTIGGLPVISVEPEMTVRQRVWAGFIKESDIVTLTGPVEVVANFDPAPTYVQARVATFAQVDQANPIASVVSHGSDTPEQDIDFGPTPLTMGANDLGLYFLNSADTTPNTQTPPQSFIEYFESSAVIFDASAGVFLALSDCSSTGTGMKLTNPVRYGVLGLSIKHYASTP
jgi:hypothetical protein